MTINQHISNIRELIKQHTTDDSLYSDEFLYNLLRVVSNKIKEDHFKDEWAWQTYCIATCIDKEHTCGCVTNAGCLVVKSKNKIPKPYRNKYQDFFKLYTLDWKKLTRISPSELRGMMYQDILKEELLYSIINDYIYIWTGSPQLHKPKALQVSMIAEDPTAWIDVTSCNADGEDTNEPCFSIVDSEFPLSPDLDYLVYKGVLELLGYSLQLDDDKTNDAKSNSSINV